MRAIPAIVHTTAMPATAPVDNPVDFWEASDAFEDPLNGAFAFPLALAVLVADVVLEESEDVVLEAVVLEAVVLEAVLLEDEDEAVALDVVVVDGTVEEVLVGAAVEIVAPKDPKVTRAALSGIWNRPIPESQHPG